MSLETPRYELVREAATLVRLVAEALPVVDERGMLIGIVQYLPDEETGEITVKGPLGTLSRTYGSELTITGVPKGSGTRMGIDRDSAIIAAEFDERDPAVKHMLHLAIQACRKEGKYVGICGQGPSDHPDFALWLMEHGIGSISLNPDSVVQTCSTYVPTGLRWNIT